MKNELRIGNYINNYNKVLSITDDGLLCTGLSIIGVVIIENPKPIPLTEEILLKCGFEKKEDGWFGLKYLTDCELSTEVTDIQINLSSFRCGVADLDNDFHSYAMTAKRIKYLHQLQNLYFALTNEELTVNL